MICDILFALLLSCIMVEQLVYRLPFLDFASVKQTDNQLLIRSVRFMQVFQGNFLSGKSGRGSFLPLPDHRDTSLISRHCRSMTVARRMPARASTAVALRLAHLTALPLDDRCPSDARSCKHGGRPPGVSRKKKRMPHMICNILFSCVRYF